MRLLVLAAVCALAVPGWAVELSADTSRAFDRYASLAEKQLRDGAFLYSDAHPEALLRARQGQTVVVDTKIAGVPVVGGLVHDWLGVSFIPGASLAGIRALMQDYDGYKRVYAPDVVDSRLLSRDGERFRAYLRLQNKQLMTVLYDSEYEAVFTAPAANRLEIVSRSTRIRQDGNDQGFLWRLNSYWRFRQADGGVYVQCRAISLSRSLPFGFGWLRGFIERFPRDSMMNAVDATRRAAAVSGSANVHAQRVN
jgi:hypothetical protein